MAIIVVLVGTITAVVLTATTVTPAKLVRMTTKITVKNFNNFR
jgi:hypothetical protein